MVWVIGYPIWHSLSPFMQNMPLNDMNMDAHYKLFQLKLCILSHAIGGYKDSRLMDLMLRFLIK